MLLHTISTKTFGDKKNTPSGHLGCFLPSKEINLLEFWLFYRFLEAYLKNSVNLNLCASSHKHLLSFGDVYMIAQFSTF